MDNGKIKANTRFTRNSNRVFYIVALNWSVLVKAYRLRETFRVPCRFVCLVDDRASPGGRVALAAAGNPRCFGVDLTNLSYARSRGFRGIRDVVRFARDQSDMRIDSSSETDFPLYCIGRESDFSI